MDEYTDICWHTSYSYHIKFILVWSWWWLFCEGLVRSLQNDRNYEKQIFDTFTQDFKLHIWPHPILPLGFKRDYGFPNRCGPTTWMWATWLASATLPCTGSTCQDMRMETLILLSKLVLKGWHGECETHMEISNRLLSLAISSVTLTSSSDGASTTAMLTLSMAIGKQILQSEMFT